VVDCIGSDHAPHARWEKLGYQSEAESLLERSAREARGRDCFAKEVRNDEKWIVACANDTQSAISDANSRPETMSPDMDCLENHKPKTSTPPGVPGLESTLPLMLSAVAAGRLSLERAVELMYHNPRRIFNLPEQLETWVELDLDARYTFPDHPLYTKCGWSPFEGRQMQGKVLRTIYKGRLAYSDGQIIEN
jgi:dihydroorotase-like cyclic amidohydrolase